MQLSKEIIEQIASYIIQNSAALTSSGLFEGKAGHALCLFEINRLNLDEKIEDSAFRILQEALLSKTSIVSFGNGLSGIGYVLLYLIKYKHIEADFIELFEKQHLCIMNAIENNVGDISILPYLIIYRDVVTVDCTRVNKAIKYLIDSSVREISESITPDKWFSCTNKLVVVIKINKLVQTIFKVSLLTDGIWEYYSLFVIFIQRLQYLYVHSYISLDKETLCYIVAICAYYDIDTAFSDMPIEMSLTELSTMELSKIINLHILHHLDSNMLRLYSPLPFDVLDDATIEEDVFRFIGNNNLLCTYDNGLLRIMSYYVLCHNAEYGCRDCYLELLV